MLNKIIVFCMFWIVLPAGIYAQSLDELYKANMKAHGGIEQMERINTVYFEMVMVDSTQHKTIVTKKWRVEPDKLRSEISTNEQNATIILNGDKGWIFSGHGKTIFELPSDQVSQARAQDFMDYNLKNYKTRYKNVENLGKVQIDNIEAYKVKLTTKENKDLYLFIDAKSFLEYKVNFSTDDNGQKKEFELVFNSFGSFNNVKYPTSIDVKLAGTVVSTLKVNKYEINKPVDPKMFEKPE